MSKDITVKDGTYYSGWREPINIWQGAPGSIHNDEVAHKIGMRGGTIPGTIHLNLFPPLLIEAFGRRWFETGSISLYYTYATLHREEVQVVMPVPPEGQDDISLEAQVVMKDGKVVAKGSVSVGNPKEPSYIRGLELNNAAPDELRILAGFEAGQDLPSTDVLITPENMDKSLETITDPLDWYKGESPWGEAVVNPSAMHNVLQLTPQIPEGQRLDAVGFFGATDIRLVNGPIKVGVPYQASGKLICVGASSKTEYFWYDSTLKEKGSDKVIAEMRQMTRFMKASSPLYLKS
ncbi:MAG: hypothetical protein JRD68_06385 [Deltaproteobacteria bacterium]|nr:hypothetical protein [Deltaproteobacteria bacterium]